MCWRSNDSILWKTLCKAIYQRKPIKFGYKLWCLSSRQGYLVQCEPYSEKSQTLPALGFGWPAWTKILPSTKSLSTLRNDGCHCSCLCLTLPCKRLGYVTSSQMQATQDCSICWVSGEKLSIFTTENIRLDNVGLALLAAQFLLLQESLQKYLNKFSLIDRDTIQKASWLKENCFLWSDGQVHSWKVQCRTSHCLFFSISQQIVVGLHINKQLSSILQGRKLIKKNER